ncbi:hypothetical protein ABPG77_008137 [Micractinium sp. CCAP 211/92]
MSSSSTVRQPSLASAPRSTGRPSRGQLKVSSIFKLGRKKEEAPAVDAKGRPIKPAPAPKAKPQPPPAKAAPKQAPAKPAPKARPAPPAVEKKAKPAPPPRKAGRPAAAAGDAGTTGTRRFSLFGGGSNGSSSSSSSSKAVSPQKAQQAPNGTTGTRGLSLFGSKPAASTGGTQKAAAGTQRIATQKVAAPAAAAQKQKPAPTPRTAGKAAAAATTGTQRVGTRVAAGTRRQARLAAAAAAVDAPAGTRASDQEYLNITGYPFPLGPFLKRPTIRKELIRGVMWGFEQPQSLGGSNVTTNIRMTVVRLQSGGLWVHAPIAPTRECVRMVRQLEEETGQSVRYIILPTFGYEHKIFVGPFSRRFPKAEVWVAPSQWSWPINLPPQFFGIFPTGELRSDDASVPWADEIEQKVFVSSVGIGPYIEAAFFHKKTRTLLVTDAVVSVPDSPPELVPEESLLEAAARNFFIDVLAGPLAAEPVDGVPLKPTELTPAARALGWRRMALQILYIVPGNLRDPRKGFEAVAERLIVGPILKTLVFSTTPEKTREWVDDICAGWDFTAIVPAHFSAPVRATPADFKAAFSFAYEPQLSQERAAAAAAEAAAAAKAGSQRAAAAAEEARRAAAAAAKAAKDDSANPAKVLDGLLISVLGGLNVSGSRGGASAPKKAAKSKGREAKQEEAPSGPFTYPAEDIAALNTARRFLVSAGVVNK